MKVIAPTRIDLAGGTLDIWPLYLFLNQPKTLNLAVSLYAQTEITKRKDKKILISSSDLKREITFDSIQSIKHNHKLNLVSRIVEFFSPSFGITLQTDCSAPAGAGLAGSSTLAISLCYALNKLTGEKHKKRELQTIAKNIEATVIQVPAGDQDYFPALYGGMNALSLSQSGISRNALKIDAKELQKRIFLVYSGTSRNSGINNWEVYKRFIDGDKDIKKSLQRIADIANATVHAVEKHDHDETGRLIGKEWECRKKMWKGVSTPEIEDIIAFSKNNGGMAAKVCGAGGGGCILLFSKNGKETQLAQALHKKGISVLDYSIDLRGVREIK